MTLQPISVLLKYGFLIALYLFLFWVATSTLFDLRRAPGSRHLVTDTEGTSVHSAVDPLSKLETPFEPRLLVDGKRLVVGPSGATIGRSRQCDVVLSDANVSRQHAELRPRGGSWVLSDLGATNGVVLNGRRIEAAEVVKPGDRIELGTSLLTFELE